MNGSSASLDLQTLLIRVSNMEMYRIISMMHRRGKMMAVKPNDDCMTMEQVYLCKGITLVML